MTILRKKLFRLIHAPLFAVVMLVTGCASEESKLSPFHVPEDSLRLAQVMIFAPRSEIVNDDEYNQSDVLPMLRATGIREADIKDGSLAIGRIYYGWEKNEKANAIAFFIPENLGVELGDIVEVKSGKSPGGGKPGTASVVTRIRQKGNVSNGRIRWIPEDDRMWHRVLYADWMPAEGWVEQTGLWRTYYKPSSPGK